MFRIERKYVTLLASERPYRSGVLSFGQDANSEEYLSKEDLRKMREDAQIFVENMLEDAKRRADLIINEANYTAGIIMQEAHGKAKGEREAILSQAKEEAKDLRKLAQLEGYAAGETEALDEARTRAEAEKQQFQALIDSTNAQRDIMINDLDDGIRGLVMEIVKKVIRIKLDESDEVFCGLVEDMVAEFHAADDLTVRISAADYTAHFGPDWKPEGRRKDDGRITLIQDEDLNLGDCRIESATAVIDCSIDKQLGVVEDALYSE